QRIQSDGANAFTFDDTGSLLTKSGTAGSFAFAYMWENRLQTINGSTSGYAYDYRNRRVHSTTSSVTTYTLYDGAELIGQATTVPVSSASSPSYFLSGAGVDEPLAMARNGQLVYLSVDGLGSIGTETSDAGSVLHTSTYDAWGGIRSETGTRQSPF